MSAKTLPGFKFILPNSNRTVVQPTPNGDLVLLIGPALDGPPNIPVPITQIQDLEVFFGPLLFNAQYVSTDGDSSKIGQYSYNELVKTTQEAILGGASNLYLCRVGGQYATSATSLLGGVTAQSRFPGFHYNGSQISAVAASTGTTLTVVSQPVSKGANGLIFSYPPSMSFQSICQAFNSDLRNTTFQLVCPAAAATGTGTATPRSLATATLSGGTYGTSAPGEDFHGVSKSALFTALTGSGGTFELLEGFNADIVYIAGIFADDDIVNSPSRSFATDLAVFCYNQSTEGTTTTGVIGVRPMVNSARTTINAAVAKWSTVNSATYDDPSTLQVNVAQIIQGGIQYTDPENATAGPIDIGRHISIVLAPDQWYQSLQLGNYVDSPAPAYAGLCSQLPPQSAATNKPVPSVLTAAYTLTYKQLDALNAGINWVEGDPFNTGGGAYVTFRQSLPGGGIQRVTEDNTAAARISDYSNLQIIRIAQVISKTVNAVGGLFIGRESSSANISALDSNLRTALDVLGTNGVVNGTRGAGYDYEILSTVQDQQIGQLGLNIWYRPARQIKQIVTFLTVNDN